VLSAEQVLRIAIVKQLYGWSYRLLRERVEDSMLLRGFYLRLATRPQVPDLSSKRQEALP
jgi:hypothetical protein